MHSTSYIIKFVLAMTVIVAAVLSLMFTVLKPVHQLNEAVYNKKAILSAFSDELKLDINAMSPGDVQSLFNDKITQQVLDMNGNVLAPEQVEKATGGLTSQADELDMSQEMKKPEAQRVLPLFIYNGDNGRKYYVLSVRGKGLWDEIWGSVALDNDGKTIVGTSFDHKGETPGLGAEIKDNRSWVSQFIGKKIYDDKGNFTSVRVVKGGAKNTINEVDGISGATITGNGVDEMLLRGLKYYEPYFSKLKK